MVSLTLQSTANERRLPNRVQLPALTLPSIPANLRSLILERLQPPDLLRLHNPPSPLFRNRCLELVAVLEEGLGGCRRRLVTNVPHPFLTKSGVC